MEKDVKTTPTSKVFQSATKVLAAIGLLALMAGAIWFMSVVLRFFW